MNSDNTKRDASSIKLGCIADDFTGATDLANNLVRAGMRVVQTIGVPTRPLDVECDAVVVASSRAQLRPMKPCRIRWRLCAGCKRRGHGKSISSTALHLTASMRVIRRGNIGPVTEALMDALGTDFTVATPAFPDNQRTVFKGYLFVGDALLSESGMRNHPLTPMLDSNLVRVLQAQCKRLVGLLDYTVVAQGETAIAQRIEQLRTRGVSIAIVDALSNADLLVLGRALGKLPLLTAGSGLAIGLPANFSITPTGNASVLPVATGCAAVVSGSCSVATNEQVREFIAAGLPAFAIDPLQLSDGVDVVQHALEWADSTNLVALSLQGACSANDFVPAITPYFVMKVGNVPLIAYHRPGDPLVADLVVDQIREFQSRGSPLRAVMLERLGPNVWHRTPAQASAVLEELEETAKLWLMCDRKPLPLDSPSIDELRQWSSTHW